MRVAVNSDGHLACYCDQRIRMQKLSGVRCFGRIVVLFFNCPSPPYTIESAAVLLLSSQATTRVLDNDGDKEEEKRDGSI